MKILQINKFFYLRGGAEKHYFDVIDLLESKGHDVVHFSMQDKQNRESPYSKYFVSPVHFDTIDTTTLRRWGRIIYSPEARRKLSALIRDTKPDIAHIHLMYHQLSPSILLALRDARIPTVMTIHDWQALCPNYNLYTRHGVCKACRQHRYAHVFFQRAIKGSFVMSGLAAFAGWFHHRMRWYEDLIQTYIAPSEFAKKLFLAYGWPEKQVVHIPHFVSSFPKIPVDLEKEPYLLYAGRLSWEKGIYQLIDSWISQNIPYTLYVAGRGPMEEAIRTRITASGASDRIHLLGFIEPEDLSGYMARAAGVIVPSVVYETFGLTIIEAWAAGTGVIARNIGPLPELVQASKGGVLFHETSSDLYYILDAYMSHPKQWEVYGRIGQAYSKEHFTKQQFYDSIIRLYTSVIH